MSVFGEISKPIKDNRAKKCFCAMAIRDIECATMVWTQLEKPITLSKGDLYLTLLSEFRECMKSCVRSIQESFGNGEI